MRIGDVRDVLDPLHSWTNRMVRSRERCDGGAHSIPSDSVAGFATMNRFVLLVHCQRMMIGTACFLCRLCDVCSFFFRQSLCRHNERANTIVHPTGPSKSRRQNKYKFTNFCTLTHNALDFCGIEGKAHSRSGTRSTPQECRKAQREVNRILFCHSTGPKGSLHFLLIYL